jgi:glucose/arabinose dehydrogenase
MNFARLYWVNAIWLLLVAAFASAQTLHDPTLQVVEVAAGLVKPTTMAFIAPKDMLVLQKEDGRVRRVLDGVLLPDPVLDLPVDFDGERGLLGIALHPAFPSVPLVYLYLTHSSTEDDTKGSPPPAGNRIYRFSWNGSSLTDPSLIANLPATPARIHAGGVMTFGPDNKLYAMIGDLDHRGQLQNIPNGPAPDDTSVILRLNDDGTIPRDNPLVNQGGNLAKYYAYGIRNGFGLAFDAVTKQLWMTENGPDAYDEVNLVEPGFNSGWIQLMGPLARNDRGVADLFQVPGSRYRDPVFSWRNTVGPTGIAFLTSSSLGERYRNHVFVGDITLGNLYHFSPNPARTGFLLNDPALADLVADTDAEFQEVLIGTGFEGITDLKVGPDGRLYVLAFGLGKIFAISGADESDHWALVPGDGLTPSAPAVTVVDGNLGLFVRGIDDRLYVNWLLPDNHWTGWALVPGDRLTPSAPAVTVVDDDLGLFVRGTDNGLYVTFPLGQ